MRRVGTIVAIVAAAALLGAGVTSHPAPPVWARPLRPITFSRSPGRLARGRYLVNGVLGCFLCHSDRDPSLPGAHPVAGREGSGHVLADDGKTRLVAPNITPDPDTGAGRWTDDMLARAIREGVGHDGRPLHPQMWCDAFQYLSDEDVASVVVYLRSLRPVRNPLPPTRLAPGRAERIEAMLHPITRPVPSRDLSTAAARGRYLTDIANCQGCHTPWEAPLDPGRFAGGNRIQEKIGDAPLTAFSRNITDDPSGIPYMDDALFIEAIRTGKVRTRSFSPIMRWVAYRNMTDDDLRAIRAYLRTVPRARHTVDPAEPEAVCPACGQRHGAGAINRPKDSAAIPIDPRALAGCEGTYVFDDAPPIVLVREGGTFSFDAGGGARLRIFTDDNRIFYAKELPDLVEFVRDPSGRVTGMIDRAFEDDRGRKVK